MCDFCSRKRVRRHVRWNFQFSKKVRPAHYRARHVFAPTINHDKVGSTTSILRRAPYHTTKSSLDKTLTLGGLSAPAGNPSFSSPLCLVYGLSVAHEQEQIRHTHSKAQYHSSINSSGSKLLRGVPIIPYSKLRNMIQSDGPVKNDCQCW